MQEGRKPATRTNEREHSAITERKLGRAISQPAGCQSPGATKVQWMRIVGHVQQKILDIPEATLIVQEKISTGIAWLF
ncbi:MAG: hypothetical protein CV089_02620 [Nitrospira sp. WS110]|nr:hypothetical protein [Nitrospira sp. WS110]